MKTLTILLACILGMICTAESQAQTVINTSAWSGWTSVTLEYNTISQWFAPNIPLIQEAKGNQIEQDAIDQGWLANDESYEIEWRLDPSLQTDTMTYLGFVAPYHRYSITGYQFRVRVLTWDQDIR